MKAEDFYGAIVHGEAWRYFLRTTNRNASERVQQERWRWFLDGWRAKCQQHNDLRKRKP